MLVSQQAESILDAIQSKNPKTSYNYVIEEGRLIWSNGDKGGINDTMDLIVEIAKQ